MNRTVIFIDGENFFYKIKKIVESSKIKHKKDISKISIDSILKEVLDKYNVDSKKYYVAKLHIHPKTKEKSQKLINIQRSLFNNLKKENYDVVIFGNVRGQDVNGKIIFKEKGVDVKIAVDLVSYAYNKKVKTAILCSSDSDLQPAVYELKKLKVKTVYIGFQSEPNKGLIYTTDTNILISDETILQAIKL
ncbi:MAG: NYN domain-containing protein [bacterium]|nr:MAG: NYN domain-containing protein [bacterium]